MRQCLLVLCCSASTIVTASPRPASPLAKIVSAPLVLPTFGFPLGVDTISAPAPSEPTQLSDPTVSSAYVNFLDHDLSTNLSQIAQPNDLSWIGWEDKYDNCWGSWYCKGHVDRKSCQIAYEKYKTSETYSRYNSPTWDHCTAMFDCKPPQSFGGSYIKERFDEIFTQGCDKCGRVSFRLSDFYPENSCSVQLNYCGSCLDLGMSDDNGLDAEPGVSTINQTALVDSSAVDASQNGAMNTSSTDSLDPVSVAPASNVAAKVGTS